MKVRDITKSRKTIVPWRNQYKPKISIITPTYKRNEEGFLTKAIESALNQSFQDFELIIIDDGSTDGSEETIRKFAACDSRIVYYRHDTNIGLPAVRTNEGILLSQGDAIAFLFDDNVFSNDFLEKTSKQLFSSDVDVIHTLVNMLMANDENFILGKWPLSTGLLRSLNAIPNGGVLCRRDFFDRYGLYDPHLMLRRICDWDLWLRSITLGAKFKFMEIIGSIEYGLISPNSLGNTVQRDIKTVYGYVLDSSQYQTRTQQLLPQTIDNFDVLDPFIFQPYIRNKLEWEEMAKTIYVPFLQKHAIDQSLLTLTNRSPVYSFRPKKRALIVSNSMHEVSDQWREALNLQQEYIVVNCSEWVLSDFKPVDIDFLILIGVCDQNVLPFMGLFKHSNIPIIYIFDEDNFFSMNSQSYASSHKKTAQQISEYACIHLDSKNKLSQIDILNLIRTAGIKKYFKNHLLKPIVLIALNSELLSGSEMYGLLLAKNCFALGFEVVVCIPKEKKYQLQEKESLIDKWLLTNGLKKTIAVAYEQRRVAHFIKSINPGIVVSALLPAFVDSVTPERFLIMTLFQPSAYSPHVLSALRGKVSWITDSEWSHSILREVVDGPSAIVRSAIEVNNTIQSCADEDVINIAIGGTLQPRKGQLEAIIAINLLRKKGYKVHLNLYGYELPELDDYLKKIDDVIQLYNLKDIVKKNGMIQLETIAKTNHLILSASLDESLPQTVAILMSFGLIPVVTFAGGIDEIVKDHVNGFIINKPNAAAIADTIETAIANKHKWPAMRLYSKEIIAKNFSSSVTINQFLNLIQSLIDKQKFQKSDEKIFIEKGIITLQTLKFNSAFSSLSIFLKKSLQYFNQRKKMQKDLSLSFEEITTVSQEYFQSDELKINLTQDLRMLPYHEYVVPLRVDRLSSVTLVFGELPRSRRGEVGIEIVSAEQKILLQKVMSLKNIITKIPVTFTLPYVLYDLEKDWFLRIFVRNVNAPISVFELIEPAKFSETEKRLPFTIFS